MKLLAIDQAVESTVALGYPAYVAAMLWGGLYLREPRLRALLPFRR